MKWNHHPTHGFRFSVTDAAAIAVVAAMTVYLLPRHPDIGWLPAYTLGHFFLFCNIFRVPRKPELIWVGCFLLASTVVTLFDLSLVWAMVAVLPVTLVILGWAIRWEHYHGIGSHPIDNAVSEDRPSNRPI